MALAYSPGDFQTNFHHHDPFQYQSFDYGYSKQAFGHQVQAQNRQGLIQVLTPIGLLVTLAATIIVALYTSYINSENNRRYQESLNNNNDNSPAPALPPRPTPSPFVTIVIRITGGGAGISVVISRLSRQAPISGETNDKGEFRASVLRNVPVEVTISGKNGDEEIISVTQTITPSNSVNQFVIPVMEKLDPGKFAITLTWSASVVDLDLAAVSVSGDCNCLFFFGGNEGTCDQGITGELEEDNILDTGIETLKLEVSSDDAMSKPVVIFVNNPEEMRRMVRSGAIITIFSGDMARSFNIPTRDPNSNSLFWFVGTLDLGTGNFVAIESPDSFTDPLLEAENECSTLFNQNYGGVV